MRIRAAVLSFVLVICCSQPTARGAESEATAAARLKEIEARMGGRIGVAAWQAGSDKRIEHKADERFAMASTFKLLLAAAVLQRVDQGEERLDRAVPFSEADVLSYAPAVKANLAAGKMTVEALCAAIMELSDNTAANLLLDTLGGPAGFTAYLRSLGDEVTRLDRKEEDLNTAIPGDPRDTTTPAAMLGSMRNVLLGDALTKESRDRLERWMVRNTTGATMIRAGVPSDWQVGDKTGRGGHASTNDVAILRPPGGEPILLCVYTTEAKVPPTEREAAVRGVARVVADAFTKQAR